MRGFDVRLIRLMVAAGALAGSALVTSVAVAADDPSATDESVLVAEPVTTDPSTTAPAPTETSDPPDTTLPVIVDKNELDTTVPFTVDKNEPPIDDIATIEIVTVDSEPVGSDAVLIDADTQVPATAAMVDGTPPGDTTTEPDAGHEGATGGQGNPYRMTFSVVWLDPAGKQIAVLDAVLPTDWRSVFELSASSRTGKGMPTSATCFYPLGNDVLQCTFHNPGHGSDTDGLVVPARPTATYQVSVVWPASGWTIDGANAGPYSARELCPRGGDGEGGGGHEGTDGGSGGAETGGEGGTGHEGGGGSGGGGGGGGGGTFWCEHTVVFQQLAAPPVDPPVDPPVVDPVVDPEVEVLPPAVQAPAATPTVGSGSLAATGGSISMILVIAGLLIAVGSALAGLSRRTS